jgi:hypothetical protein
MKMKIPNDNIYHFLPIDVTVKKATFSKDDKYIHVTLEKDKENHEFRKISGTPGQYKRWIHVFDKGILTEGINFFSNEDGRALLLGASPTRQIKINEHVRKDFDPNDDLFALKFIQEENGDIFILLDTSEDSNITNNEVEYMLKEKEYLSYLVDQQLNIIQERLEFKECGYDDEKVYENLTLEDYNLLLTMYGVNKQGYDTIIFILDKNRKEIKNYQEIEDMLVPYHRLFYNKK